MINIAIDANEANVPNRVGSNVYAYHLICELAKLVVKKQEMKVTMLLSAPPLDDLPKETESWHYEVISPSKFFTQFALPLYLHQHQSKIDLFFTPGHYAPRFCSVPYISSVMDLGYLHFPEQFKTGDLLQLKHWTKYSVNNAAKVVAISEFTRREIINFYHKKKSEIEVIYPDVSLPKKPATQTQLTKFFQKHAIAEPFFLFVGTLQPRKNLITLVKAYEKFCQGNQKKSTKNQPNDYLPQLVIAGKIGWLADEILEAINNSPVKDKIVLTDFVTDEIKMALYQHTLATVLVGLYEGFGIPPLESMHCQTLPIASNHSSLPEVVGKAGLLVNPHKPETVAEALTQAWTMSDKEKKKFQEEMREQIKKFSWQKSAEKLYELLIKTAKEISHENSQTASTK